MPKLLKKNIIFFYVANFFLTLAQSLPHSILTVLLLNKGLSLSDIVIIQAMFSLAVLLFEIPSGILADLYSRKILYIFSIFLLMIVSLLILVFDDFIFLALAWFIYGLSTAFYSDTLETGLVNDIKRLNALKHSTFIHNFLRYKNQIQFFSMLLGSLLGSFLYFIIGVKIYLLAIAFLFCAIFCILFFKEQSLENKEKVLKKHLFLSLKEFKDNKALKILFILSLISQIFFQTHYQLWQAFFLEKGVNEEYLYLFYLSFQFLGIFVLYLGRKEQGNLLFFNKICIFILFCSPLLLMHNFSLIFLAYMLLVAAFIFLDYKINALFNSTVSKERISILSAAKSSFSRICAFVFLLVCSLFLKYFSVSTLVFINFLLALSLIIILIFLSKKFLNPE